MKLFVLLMLFLSSCATAPRLSCKDQLIQDLGEQYTKASQKDKDYAQIGAADICYMAHDKVSEAYRLLTIIKYSH